MTFWPVDRIDEDVILRFFPSILQLKIIIIIILNFSTAKLIPVAIIFLFCIYFMQKFFYSNQRKFPYCTRETV